MPLNKDKIKAPGKRRDLPEIENGSYAGRIVQIVDVGMQPQTDYDTGEKSDPKEIMFVGVEYPRLRIETEEGDKPRWLSKQFKVSKHENSAMVKYLDPLLKGKKSYGELINLPVMTTIAHTSGGNPKIVNISLAPEELTIAELENDAIVFDFYEPDLDEFKKLPAWLQRVCMEAEDYKGSQLETIVEASGMFEEE